jgi:hypothetical protein
MHNKQRKGPSKLSSSGAQSTVQKMSYMYGQVSLASEPNDCELSTELIIKIYRCAMAGLACGDISSWEIGQRLLTKSVPPKEVGPLFGQFYGFGRALLAAAQRPLSCQPISYSGNCADEALALRMIEIRSVRTTPGRCHRGQLRAARPQPKTRPCAA